MLRKLKRIAPLQCGLVLGTLYGLISLIFVPFVALFIVAAQKFPASPAIQSSMQIQTTGSMQQMPGFPPHMAGILAGASLVMVLIIPVLYAILGFIGGVIASVVYNIAAKITGGIEVEVE